MLLTNEILYVPLDMTTFSIGPGIRRWAKAVSNNATRVVNLSCPERLSENNYARCLAVIELRKRSSSNSSVNKVNRFVAMAEVLV